MDDRTTGRQNRNQGKWAKDRQNIRWNVRFKCGTGCLPPEIDQIKHLKVQDQHAVVEAEITKNEWTSLWAKCKQSTGTGDSGLHFAMFKSNCKSKKALAVDLAMARISHNTGLPLSRWKKSINVFLQKKNKSTLASKQRIIHLWKADANALFKILARQSMRLKQERGIMAEEQFGSRPKHSAPSLSLAKRLTFDMARQRRQTMAMCCNDATQCYDCIIHKQTCSIGNQASGNGARPSGMHVLRDPVTGTSRQNSPWHVRSFLFKGNSNQ